MNIVDRFREIFSISECGKFLVNKITRGNNGLCLEGCIAGSLNKINGHRSVRVDGKPYYESKVIWAMTHGELPEKVIHINGDSTDNRIENLYIPSQRASVLRERRHEFGHKELSEVFDYNPSDGVIRWKIERRKKPIGSIAGGLDNSKGYIKVCYKCITYGCHRVAWLLHYGKWPDGEIDHINGNRSDNRICNLRDIPAEIQAKNLKLNKRNKTGISGVYKAGRRYVVTIGHLGKSIKIGSFLNIEDAANARYDAEIKYNYHKNHGKR